MTVITAKQFSVDEAGGYVTELYDQDGQALLFPRTMIGGKLRGGSHVCFPYFGPDEAGIVPQHGFGRAVTWRGEASPDRRTVTCVYDEMQDELFSGLHAELEYRLNEAGSEFTTTLTVTNHSDQPRALTPGFHPYFAIDPTDVMLSGVRINVVDFEPFQSFPDTTQMTIETAARTVTVVSENLTHMVVWTDSKGEYLCVEPTLRGNGFDSRGEISDGIAPGQTMIYQFSILW
ncbi:MAG TPA: hypothetical protein PKD28_01400 [Candidatus Saccharibacteria bacterium]|nr:hypothetical protein [Candidatus Saccharibacteria bacterium]